MQLCSYTSWEDTRCWYTYLDYSLIVVYLCTRELSNSVNTTLTGSPNLISADDAKAIVAEAAPPGSPKPIDPEGMTTNILCSLLYDYVFESHLLANSSCCFS